MHTEYVAFPVGSWMGVPTLVIDIGHDEELDQDLLWELRGRVRPGTQLFWPRHCPWGGDGWDDLLSKIMGDDRVGDIPLAAFFELGKPASSNLDQIDWIIQIPEGASSADDRSSFHRYLTESINYVPSAREVLWKKPHIGLMMGRTMDLINEVLRPEICSWVMVPTGSEYDDMFDAAVNATSRATHRWGVRRYDDV